MRAYIADIVSRDLVRILLQQPTLRQRVRVAAAAAGLTFSQLAERADINLSVLSRGIHEKQILSDVHKARIAAVLGVPQAVLFPEPTEREGAA